MSGTQSGGFKASQTNKAKYGQDFYRRIGALGGANGHTGGFYQNRELAARAGKIGGTISKRGPKIDIPLIDLEDTGWGARLKRLWR